MEDGKVQLGSSAADSAGSTVGKIFPTATNPSTSTGKSGDHLQYIVYYYSPMLTASWGLSPQYNGALLHITLCSNAINYIPTTTMTTIDHPTAHGPAIKISKSFVGRGVSRRQQKNLSPLS